MTTNTEEMVKRNKKKKRKEKKRKKGITQFRLHLLRSRNGKGCWGASASHVTRKEPSTHTFTQ